MSIDLQSCLLIYLIFLIFPNSLLYGGMRDAFEYKKGKTKVRKEKLEISLWRKLLCWYKPEQTKVPWHMCLFKRLRIFYAADGGCAIIALVFLENLPRVLVWMLMIPGIVVSIILYTYCATTLSNWPRNDFNFENAKHQ